LNDSDETNRFEPTPFNKEIIMEQNTKTPFVVSLSIWVAKQAGQTAGVTREIKECSVMQYKASKEAAQAASDARIKNFVPKV
jgi:hypothetical protein